MGRTFFWLGVTLAAMACSAGRADEVSELKDALSAQERQSGELRERIDQLESRQRLEEKSTSAKLAEVEKKADETKDMVLPDWLKWTQAIKLSGDFRYRYEGIDQEGKDDRHRNRIRARLGLAAKVNDEWDAGLRLATGEKGDPVSTNQSLDQSFSEKSIWLDTALLSYRPTGVKGLTVTAGKMDVPFLAVGKNQLIWDGDLTPEGGAVQYTHSLSKQTKVTVQAGGFWVAENEADVDPSLWGFQAYVAQGLGGPSAITAGVSYYDYANLQGYTNLKREWDSTSNSFFGNSPMGGSSGTFANDYDLVEVFAELSSKVGKLPVSAFGSYVMNTGTEDGYDEDSGWLVGFKLNKAADPGTWELGYDYRDLGADAVVGQFSDSDFIGGGTDGKGHRFSFVYQVAKNVQAGLTYLSNQITRSSTEVDYNRLQADLVVKFK